MTPRLYMALAAGMLVFSAACPRMQLPADSEPTRAPLGPNGSETIGISELTVMGPQQKNGVPWFAMVALSDILRQAGYRIVGGQKGADTAGKGRFQLSGRITDLDVSHDGTWGTPDGKLRLSVDWEVTDLRLDRVVFRKSSIAKIRAPKGQTLPETSS